MTDVRPPEPLGEDYYQHRPAFFARLRETRPVAPAELPGYGRVWLVTRYADVRAVLADARFSRDVHRWPGGGRTRPSESRGVYAHMLHADPPEHTRLRRSVQKHFTPRRAALRPRAEQVAAELLDAMADTGAEVDLLTSYARPLPIAVLCELLGIPASERGWLEQAVIAYDDRDEHDRVERDLAAYFAQLVADRRGAPGDDLVSALVTPDAEDSSLSDDELLSTVFLLVMAGFDTTVNLITSGILALLTHPEQATALRADPSLMPAAVEELLRFTGPVNHANDRFTLVDVQIGDVVIPAGEWVLPVIGSADRDAERFAEPDRLDLRRDTAGHLAFGHGVHHCLGAPLARMEADVGLSALLVRHPTITLAADPAELRWRTTSLMTGLGTLPVHLR